MREDEVNAQARATQRVKDLVEQRGLTGRAFAKRLGHGDQWASNLKKGRARVQFDELDVIAEMFGVPPGALIARPGEEAWILTPTEMRMVRVARALPPSVRDHVVQLLEYIRSVTPDEIELLQQIRRLEEDERRKIEHWIAVMRLARSSGRETPAPPDPVVSSSGAAGSIPPVRTLRRKK